MKRSSSSDGVPSASHRASDAQLCHRFPLLTEHLTALVWEEDQSDRETSTLLLFAEDGRWKVRLHDRAEARSGWVTADTVHGAFQALEDGLREGTLDWRPSPEGGARGRRKG